MHIPVTTLLTVAVLYSMSTTILAAPQITVTKWPPAPPLPSICGVLYSEPACPYGYVCRPYVNRYCEDLEDDDELCGYCSPTSNWSPTSTPTPTPTVQQSSSNGTIPIPITTTSCPGGYVGDYRGRCSSMRVTATSSSSKSTLTCPSGFTKDYRGMEYCRPTYYVARATKGAGD